jgi:hypothetical protein
MPDTIDAHGDPLVFKTRKGSRRSPLLTGGEGHDLIKVEARQMHHHQKEAVVTEGAGGDGWRIPSDEGAQLSGTDLAPFPLGIFNAGLQSDLFQRICRLARERGVTLDDVEIDLITRYWASGSFVQGTSTGHAEPADIEVRVQSPSETAAVADIVHVAMAQSPAMALLRQPLTNTFAIYINGRRRVVEGVENSLSSDAADPFRIYAQAPRPLADAPAPIDLVEKTGKKEEGTPQLAPSVIPNRMTRQVNGYGRRASPPGLYEVETWLGLPGSSHFRICSSDGAHDNAPSGLALLAAGISFCYMTHLSRFIQYMKLPIHGVRLVQLNPFDIGGRGAKAGPVDTHLFLNGEAPEEIHVDLLSNAARACYLHAACASAQEPQLRIVHNGAPIARVA